jgi:hypothetical protein
MPPWSRSARLAWPEFNVLVANRFEEDCRVCSGTLTRSGSRKPPVNPAPFVETYSKIGFSWRMQPKSCSLFARVYWSCVVMEALRGSDAIALDRDSSPGQLAPVGLQASPPLESVNASVNASDQVGFRRQPVDHQLLDHLVDPALAQTPVCEEGGRRAHRGHGGHGLAP